MAQVTKVQALVDYKKALGVSSLDLIQSKAGGLYVVANGQAVMLAPNTDVSKEMFVVSMLDRDTGETWDFITSTKPKPLNVVGQI